MMEWSIQARARLCKSCGRAFKNREPVHTLLFSERQAYNRLDVCDACWAAQHSQGSTQRKGFVSHWLSTYTPPEPAPPEPIRRERAEGLLCKLVELKHEQYAGPCFILAVMLERRRVLKARSQAIESGRRVIVYEHSRTGEMFTVVDPNLRLDQLDAVQRDVARLLEQGPTAQTEAPSSQPASAEAGTEVISPASALPEVQPNADIAPEGILANDTQPLSTSPVVGQTRPSV